MQMSAVTTLQAASQIGSQASKNVIQLKMARLYAEVQYCFGEFAVYFTSKTLVPNITKKV